MKISVNFIPKGPITNIPSLVQIMAWHQPGDKPLSEPMMVRLLTHICVTGPELARNWRRSSWTFSWKSLYKKIPKAPRRNMRTWALNKWYHFVPHSLLSVTGVFKFPIVRYFTWIPWIFRSVSVSVAGNQMALGSVLSCVLRHTIMTSPTCALTQLIVPDNHRQGCQRCHLKLNTCFRRNFKQTNFNLFLAILIK